MGQEIKQGEIYWVRLDPTEGAEVNKTHPCVVVSPDQLNRNIKTVIIIPLTQQVREHFKFRTKVKANKKIAQAMCDQIKCVSKKRIGDKIESISEEELKDIKTTLHQMFQV